MTSGRLSFVQYTRRCHSRRTRTLPRVPAPSGLILWKVFSTHDILDFLRLLDPVLPWKSVVVGHPENTEWIRSGTGPFHPHLPLLVLGEILSLLQIIPRPLYLLLSPVQRTPTVKTCKKGTADDLPFPLLDTNT